MNEFINHGHTLPPWQFYVPGTPPEPGAFAWSGAEPPPKIGAWVDIRINGLGKACVVGYATQSGFLGVMTQIETVPSWHSGEPALTFGAELRSKSRP
jgi:hypothetical protein